MGKLAFHLASQKLIEQKSIVLVFKGNLSSSSDRNEPLAVPNSLLTLCLLTLSVSLGIAAGLR